MDAEFGIAFFYPDTGNFKSFELEIYKFLHLITNF